MFGHQDHDDHHDNQPEPQADAMLSHDAATLNAPSTPPVSHPTDDNTDDTAGDFIMTEPEQHHEAKSIADDQAPAPETPSAPAPAPGTDDLLELKQDALQQLTPLVGHLDQTPEEKFRTTMMMIQASDNQSLLKTAYEAAQQITDEKARAQALLDVVNEINYFTQQSAGDHANEE